MVYQQRESGAIYNLYAGRTISAFAYREMCNYYLNYDFSIVLTLLLCLYGIIGTFVGERETQMDMLLLVSPNGGRKTALAKIFAATLFLLLTSAGGSADGQRHTEYKIDDKGEQGIFPEHRNQQPEHPDHPCAGAFERRRQEDILKNAEIDGCLRKVRNCEHRQGQPFKGLKRCRKANQVKKRKPQRCQEQKQGGRENFCQGCFSAAVGTYLSDGRERRAELAHASLAAL